MPGKIEDVAALISAALSLPRWWPSVYLAVEEVEPSDADGVGRVVELLTRGGCRTGCAGASA